MDATTEPLPPAADESRSPIARSEIRAILSNLSHEMSRPLVSLRMGFDLLLADSAGLVSNEQRGHVRTMILICDDLLRLTRSYLDYAGLVQGVRPLCLGAYTVGALVREIERQFAPAAEARRIAWSCTLEGPDAVVTTDAARCQQVFGNLVANALKYAPEGGEVAVRGRLEDGGWEVTVTDNGPGIPDDQLDRVFEPFYRLSRDDTSRVDGNGLGLAVCRELVGQLRGSIRLDSGVGQGTRVTVRFPTEAADRAAPPPR